MLSHPDQSDKLSVLDDDDDGSLPPDFPQDIWRD